MRLVLKNVIVLVFCASLSACTQKRPVMVRDPSHCEALQIH
jgi:predicted small lipoprotein YifL